MGEPLCSNTSLTLSEKGVEGRGVLGRREDGRRGRVIDSHAARGRFVKGH